MNPLRALWRGIAALVRSRQADIDVDDELAHFAAESKAAHIARGLSPDEARRAAARETGNALATRETVRSTGWEHAVETAMQDVRYGLRRLRKNPLFTATAALTLAIGIGASTAVFSAVYPILIEPLPFPDANRVVTVEDQNENGFPMPATLGTFAEVQSRSRSFDVLAAADGWRPSLTGTGTPERIVGQRVTADYFRTFGAVPLAGRDFTADERERGAPLVAIVSSAFAARRFGGNAVVGHEIELDGDRYQVVGVMPPGFVNAIAPAASVWAPLREQVTGDLGGRVWGHHYDLVGRLTPAATVESATHEIVTIGAHPVLGFLRPRWADLARGLIVRPMQESLTASAKPALYSIVASVALFLVIAAVNVANLLLARGAQRRAEFAMRMALGAGRGRILRQLLTESVVLAALGGVLGMFVAELGVRALVAASPPGLPRVDAIAIRAPVLVFAILLTTIVGTLIGLAPALGAARGGLADGVRLGSGRTTGSRAATRKVLVVAEVALASVLLVNGGLLFRSVNRLMAMPPGFDPANTVTLQLVEAGHAFDRDAARLQFYDAALAAARHVPGVTDAAFTSLLPLSGEIDGYGYEVQSRPDRKAGENGSALRYVITPDYFATMRIPLVAGRFIDANDRQGTPLAVVISQVLAQQAFGSANPIGQRLRFGPQMQGDHAWMEVVGVVGDVRHYTLAVGGPPAFYVANGQWDWVDNVETLVVRASGSAAALVPAIKSAVWRVNANVPVPRVRTMEGFVTASAGSRRFTLLALEALANGALVLAAVGLYGVIAGGVADRIREIGVRTALGASPRDVIGLVVGQAMALAGAGVALGLAGGYASSRLIATMLFGVSSFDAVTYGAVAGLMAAVALLAAWAPAQRAVGVDPTIALHAE